MRTRWDVAASVLAALFVTCAVDCASEPTDCSRPGGDCGIVGPSSDSSTGASGGGGASSDGSSSAVSSGAGGATSASSGASGGGGATGAGGGAGVTPIWGVTVDDPWTDLDGTVAALQHLKVEPTTRIVFDEGVAASEYVPVVQAIGGVSRVMGEILDSEYVDTVSVAGYQARANEYVNALGGAVDVWEVGNEVNGEWLGKTSDVVAKISGAFDLVKSKGYATELTLYYNQDCWSDPNHEMFTWAGANVPDAMKQGLDDVLVSYYEDDCNGLQPDWPAVFAKLAAMFPNSKIGFGECGTVDAAKKAAYVQHYYGMKIPESRYVGGYFWWYFSEDMVPWTNPLWQTLNDAIQP